MANEFKHKDPGTALTQAEFIASDGTGHIFESQAQGDILYATSTTVLARLGKDANATRVLTNTGTNNNPAWAQVTLTSGVTGTLPVANGGTGITSLASGVATFLGTSSSANLRSALTDETGTGAAVFANTPTLVTPALGTPGSGVLTNCTGLPTAGILDNNVTLAKIEDIARGSVIVGNASAATAELTIGSNTYVLTSDGTDIAWAAAAGGIASVAADTTPQVGGSAGFDLQAQLLVGNGGTTGIAISANGEVNMAAQPCVLAYNSASDDNVTGNGTETTIDFNTEVIDQNSDFASDTLTAPVTGQYLITFNAEVRGLTSSATLHTWRIKASNRTVYRIWVPYDVAYSGQVGSSLSAILDMDADDTLTITLVGSGESGDVQDINGQDATQTTYFSAQLIS